MNNKPDVSIVVCTFNRAHMLGEALESLSRLETDGKFVYEVVVVDNASTDHTQQIVQQVAESSPVTFRSVRETNQGIVFARNRGIEAAHGEWIAFFDDDQIADERWLFELMQMAEQKKVRTVGGAVHLRLPADTHRNLSPFCRVLLGETVGMTAEQPYNQKTTPGAGNWLLHKSVFEEVGLFDKRFNRRGEDTDLFLRIHEAEIEAWYTPTAVVHHMIPAERLNDKYLLKVSRLMAEGMASDDQNRWGRLLYPLVWCGRIGQAAGLFGPKLLWSSITRNAEQSLGLRCRLVIAAGSIREGLALMLPSLAANRTSSAYHE